MPTRCVYIEIVYIYIAISFNQNGVYDTPNAVSVEDRPTAIRVCALATRRLPGSHAMPGTGGETVWREAVRPALLRWTSVSTHLAVL